MNTCLRNRHLRINILFAAQSLKCIPLWLRRNTSVFCIGKTNCMNYLTQLWEESCSESCTLERFLEIYRACTSEKYGALVLDYTGEEKNRFRRRFGEAAVVG